MDGIQVRPRTQSSYNQIHAGCSRMRRWQERSVMSSRDDILAALRKNAPPAVEAPSLDGLGVTFADPLAQLAQSVVAVGGACVRVADLAAAAAAVDALP